MPANWNLPTLTSNYATGVLQVISERLVDAVTLFNGDGTNMPNNAMHYDRTNNKFQERLAGAWVDKILSLAGGGSGASTAAGARTNFGLGTMAVQDSNNVNITGGAISGLASLTISGTMTANLFSGSGASLTNLNASNLATGTVPTARLGSGSASSSNFLRGDQTWAAPVGTLPAGLIAIFDAACPSGWTRVSAFDGRFVRGATSYGATGGASTHSHTTNTTGSHGHGISGSTASTNIDHTHHVGSAVGISGPDGVSEAYQAGFSSVAASSSHHHTNEGYTDSAGSTHNHGVGTLSIGAGGDHSHTVSTTDHTPPYIDVVFCKKD